MQLDILFYREDIIELKACLLYVTLAVNLHSQEVVIAVSPGGTAKQNIHIFQQFVLLTNAQLTSGITLIEQVLDLIMQNWNSGSTISTSKRPPY